ncbi:MAG TPA: hypothetical protein VIF88_00230 [Methylocystis sp.]|jgi:hypothetical protein
MAKQVTQTDGALKTYALRLLDTVYDASVYSVIGYSALLGVLAVVGLAIFMKIIYVPEFHPW